MWKFINSQLDRIESRIALWLWLGSSGLIGVLTAWWSTASSWVTSIGDFVWVLIGLAASALALLVLALGLHVRFIMNKAWAIRRWVETSENVNPLDTSFDKRRISFSALVDPLSQTIKEKQFVNCQLNGPAVILVTGRADIIGVTFSRVDAIEIADRPQNIFNVIALEDCKIIGGRIANVTIIAYPQLIGHLREMGLKPLTDS